MDKSVISNNEVPDYAAEVMARLRKDYALILENTSNILARLRALPNPIEDEATLSDYSKVIVEARDLRKRLAAYHDAEKAPFLRGGQGCDQFFFGEIGKLGRRGDREPAGGIDIADARVDDYMQRKLAAEREAREALAAIERRKAEEIRQREEKARQAALEASQRAARARNAETIAAHRAEADRQAIIAAEERARQLVADQEAEDARIDTLAPAADMTRTRLESGALATMNTTPFVQITDVTLLNKERLWPHLKEEHILMALKSWAKTTSHKTPMTGAVIELRNKGGIR
ncbi:MAG TPA: hypothetical protein VK577_20850 [Bradyrhizobium sp.]|nr:hypothetical protein [Bradyrhizobium sp.]